MRFFYLLTGQWELPLLPPIKALVRDGFCRCHYDVKTDIRCSGPRPVAMNRRSHSTTERYLSQAAVMPDTTVPDWKVQSEAVALRIVPTLRQYNSQETSLLLVLFCFLESSQLTTELLWRGSTHRRRWSQLGEATEVGAFETCLDRDLGTMFSDHSGLSHMYHKLEAAHVIRVDSSTGMGALDQQVVARVTDSLPRTLKPFWMHQALLITIHGFPRKYLEPK